MKIKLLILCLLTLTGCVNDVNPEYITQLQNQCLKNGGVAGITTMNMDAATHFDCKDGASFVVYHKQK